MSTCDVAFSESVKRVQRERGSRDAYARVESAGGFETEVTSELRAFLAEIDTAFLATASAGGQPYVQHRGGPPGFVGALEDHTLALVELGGNRQYITAGNLAENDRVCLLLIDYVHRRRVKIWGRARFVGASQELLARLPHAPRGRPEGVLLIEVAAWDANCPQHIPRKLPAAAVEETLRALRARIDELEAENRRLRRRG